MPPWLDLEKVARLSRWLLGPIRTRKTLSVMASCPRWPKPPQALRGVQIAEWLPVPLSSRWHPLRPLWQSSPGPTVRLCNWNATVAYYLFSWPCRNTTQGVLFLYRLRCPWRRPGVSGTRTWERLGHFIMCGVLVIRILLADGWSMILKTGAREPTGRLKARRQSGEYNCREPWPPWKPAVPQGPTPTFSSSFPFGPAHRSRALSPESSQ